MSMSGKRFDPFQDRLSRDIRNELSSLFMDALQEGSMSPLQQAAEKYRQQPIASFYKEYIDDRLARYEKALAELKKRSTEEAICQAMILWDNELFFEVHEFLEEEWLQAEGDNRLILQALIRAAGVYVHKKAGNRKGAQGMAAKAAVVLKEYGHALPKCINLDRLLHSLQNIDEGPPKLLV